MCAIRSAPTRNVLVSRRAALSGNTLFTVSFSHPAGKGVTSLLCPRMRMDLTATQSGSCCHTFFVLMSPVCTTNIYFCEVLAKHKATALRVNRFPRSLSCDITPEGRRSPAPSLVFEQLHVRPIPHSEEYRGFRWALTLSQARPFRFLW
jgi:hypothetical protein